ncbi:MAG: RsmD family RNA methyltransferase [Desulfobacterota bacterium]|nr:RsmD family RNA methyltransferase [Thermodesulfobacteriota bacterium]
MGTVRIISGKLKGRAVETPGGQTRPLLSRLRKSLADILRPHLAGARILDLFGGSGAITFELLSNGASSAVIVELDPVAAQMIQKNIHSLSLDGVVEMHAGDALSAISIFERRGDVFDVIVIAPPYGQGLHTHALERVACSRLLGRQCIVVVQRDQHEPCAPSQGLLEKISTRSYGRTLFDFYAVRHDKNVQP